MQVEKGAKVEDDGRPRSGIGHHGAGDLHTIVANGQHDLPSPIGPAMVHVDSSLELPHADTST